MWLEHGSHRASTVRTSLPNLQKGNVMPIEQDLVKRVRDDIVAAAKSTSDVLEAITGVARNLVADAARLGEDLAVVGLGAVQGAIKAAGSVSVTTEAAAEAAAATGAIDAAAAVSTDAGKRVQNAVTGTVDGVKVIVKTALK
jgi:hypothetical protein